MAHVSFASWVVIGEFVVAFVALVVFVLFYTLSSHGRALKSPEGRHMINFRSSLAAWMVMGVVHNLVPDYPGRDLVRVLVIGWAAVAASEGTYLVIRAQRDRRRRSREAARSGEGIG